LLLLFEWENVLNLGLVSYIILNIGVSKNSFEAINKKAVTQ